MHKTLVIAFILLFAGTAASASNTYTLHQINGTHWYFETNQTALADGTYNYTVFANNISSEYRLLYVDSSTPPNSITSLTNRTGNFYHNWTWQNPTNSDFNYTMVYINGIRSLNTSLTHYNLSASPHNCSTISTHTVDTNENINNTWVNHTSVIPNNPVTITGGTDRKVDIGESINVSFSSSDVDGDTPVFSCSRTDLFTDFNTTTGQGNWTPSKNGVYYVDFGVSDGWGSTDNYTMTITVGDITNPLTSSFETSLSLAGILVIIAIVIGTFSMLTILFTPTSKMDFEAVGIAVVSVIVLLALLYIAIMLCNSIANA